MTYGSATLSRSGRKKGLVAVISVVALLAACGNGDDPPQASAEKPADQKTVKMKMNATAAPDHPYTPAFKAFIADVATATENTSEKVDIQLFEAGQLFDIASQAEALLGNEVEIAELVSPYLTGIMPATGVIDLPFLWESRQHQWDAVDGEFGELLNEAVRAAGAEPIAFLDNGANELYNTVGPIEHPDDVKGKKLRLPGTYFSAWGAGMGAEPVSIPGSEALLGMQQGTLDGHITPPAYYVTRKQFEVAKYATRGLELSRVMFMLGFNADVWSGLSADTQEAIRDEGAKLQTTVRQAMAEAEADYNEQIKEVSDVTEIDEDTRREVWMPTGEPVIEQWLNDVGPEVGQPLLEAVESARS